MGFRRRVYEVLNPTDRVDVVARTVNLGLFGLILANVLAMIIETVDAAYALCPAFFKWFEIVSVVVFSLEYVARVWACVEDPSRSRPLGGRLRFALSFMALVDLLAIAPFYLPFLGVDLRSLRAVRLLRGFRLLKMGRYSRGLRTLRAVVRSKRDELVALVAVLAVLLVIASTSLYFAENDAQPEAFSSIPAAMWWAVVTLTTVGYGDVYPVTEIGRALAGVIAVLGVGLFGLPAAVLASGFVEQVHAQRRMPRLCPHCGEEIAETGCPQSP